MMMLVLLLSAVALSQVPTELSDYVNRPDSEFRWSVSRAEEPLLEIEMISQRWQGIEWRHAIAITKPPGGGDGTAILAITGGRPNPRDLAELRTFSAESGLPAAMLFDIPNQPIFGRNEDDLIAHTFERFLESGDASWPLLFPMAKSAIRAMDAIEQATKDWETPIRRFVVTGASKRGWTTWLAGATGDERIVGIAPMVIDTLNIPAQMKHQMASWGRYSEMIADYTSRDLPAALGTDPGQRLSRMVDPYSYRALIKAPTLIVNGANDRYWSVDALKLYWPDLAQPKWVLTVPNAGHGLGDGRRALESISIFARAMAGEFEMPRLTWRLSHREGSAAEDTRGFLYQLSSEPGAHRVNVWVAESESLDFRESEWKIVAHAEATGAPSARSAPILSFLLPAKRNAAVFAEFRLRMGGKEFSLTSPVEVVPSF
jgi:PhoPQ-activated pathogenicity-related protein